MYNLPTKTKTNSIQEITRSPQNYEYKLKIVLSDRFFLCCVNQTHTTFWRFLLLLPNADQPQLSGVFEGTLKNSLNLRCKIK